MTMCATGTEISRRATRGDLSSRGHLQSIRERSGGGPSGFDAQAARRFLEMLRTPSSGCIELRVLRAVFDRAGSIRRGESFGRGCVGTTLAGWFDDDARMIDQARR